MEWNGLRTGLCRFVVAALALAASVQFGARDLLSHAHGLGETDLVAHAVERIDGPHSGESLPLHLDGVEHHEHAACFDCLLSALAPDFASGAVALAAPIDVVDALPSREHRARFERSSRAASPRGPPSVA